MAIHVAGITLPGPNDVLDSIRAVTGWSAEATEVLAELPGRLSTLFGDIDTLLRRINEVAAGAEVLVSRIDLVAAAAEQTVAAVTAVTDRATTVVGQVNTVAGNASTLVTDINGISGTANDLVALYQPLATRAAPLAQRFVDELSEHEITAAVRMVDQLPALAEHLETDIMPILATLDRVGPDIHELLTVVKDLRNALDGIPGLGFLRRRGENSD